jgi:serine/threonine-protein kinase
VNLGGDLDRAGQYAEAADALERALAIRRRVLGPRHPLVGVGEIALAGVLADENRLDEAGRTSEAALAILRGSLPGDHPRIREALNMLGVIRVARRDFAGAVPPFRELLARYTRVSGRSHPDTLTVENNLAVALMHTGEAQEAESLQREVLRLLPADDGQATAAMTRQNLAGALEIEGKLAAAVDLAREALQVQRRREGMTSANVAVALRSLALAEEMNGEASHAEADFRAGLAMGAALARTHRIDTYEWKVPLADFLVGAQRCDEALPLLASATAEIADVKAADPIWQPQIDLLAARCDPSSPRSDERMRAASRTLRALPAVDVDLYPTARGILRRSTE